MAKTVKGRQQVWELLETVGRGDAGEVMRVKAQPGKEQGVMKRPVQNVSGGTIVRQARQIENEGRVLALLDGMDVDRNGRKAHTPLLMDQSIEGTSSSANLFIISEEVPGVSVSDLLRRRMQGGSPISQVIVLKVLAAAFQLLQKVHEKGVVWNDVKMDHIFWDAENNTLSFIDWGNSLDLKTEPSEDNVSPMLDYRQLLEEGRTLMEQTAPELIGDTGWPMSASNLKQQDIAHLQMRVEYMETYLSMRIIEYKLLYSRYLKSLDSLDGLRQTLDLTHALLHLGVEVETADLLSACQNYLLGLLDRAEDAEARQAYQMIEAELRDNLTPSWQLAGYLLAQFEASDPQMMAKLLHAVFENNWVDAAWIYQESFLRRQAVPFTDSVINSMRSLQLNLKPYALIYSDIESLRQQTERWLETAIQKNLDSESITTLKNLTARVSQIQENWGVLQPGEKLGDKFLLLRQTLEHYAALQLRPVTDLQTSLLAAMSRIRDIYRAWASSDLAAARKQTRELFLIEPSLGYLPELEADFAKMIDWLEMLHEGPAQQKPVNRFSEELLASLPPIASRLGEAPWLTLLLHALQVMKDAQAIENLREEARLGQWPLKWMDLQSLHLDIAKSVRETIRLDAPQKASLDEFHHALRASVMPSLALHKIRQYLPAFHQAYAELAAAFAALFSQLHGELPLPEVGLFPLEDQAQVSQVLKVLTAVRAWKDHIRSGDPAKFAFPAELTRAWQIPAEIQNEDQVWRSQILPKLTEIKQKRWEDFPVDLPAASSTDLLDVSRSALARLQAGWKRIPEQGLYPELIQEMIYQTDTAQANFFQYWAAQQQGKSVVSRWLCENYKANFSEINQSLLQIARKLRNVALAHSVINHPEMASTRTAMNSAGDLMFTLVQLDEHIMPRSRKPSVFRGWQSQYLELLKQGDRRGIVESIQTIESIHPLLPWFDELVRRDADYFDLPKSYQW